jgi:hypothetical protein
MARFVAVPGLPEEGLSDAQSILITAIKQNVELLTGLRDEADLQSKAVTKGDITVNLQPLQNLRQTSAKGEGFTISGQDVVSLEDYGKLLTDVQTLANDLAFTRAVLNALIEQIKG